jgi:hypothetical protein
MVLKKEFNIDISRMAELYKIKEEDFMKKISQHEIEVNKLRKIIDDLMEGNKKLDDSFIAVQAQSMRIKKQVFAYLSLELMSCNGYASHQ